MPVIARSSKITSSHRTLTETSAEIISVLDRMVEVSKISLGAIRHVPGGRKNLKFHPMIGGVKIVVRGNGAVHDLYVYTAEPDTVKQQVLKKFVG